MRKTQVRRGSGKWLEVTVLRGVVWPKRIPSGVGKGLSRAKLPDGHLKC